MRAVRVLVSLLAAGCSIAELPPAPNSVAVNECGDTGCNCYEGACTKNGTLGALLIEVTPPASADEMAGKPFYVSPEAKVEQVGRLDRIEIGPIARVNGTITVVGRDGCVYQNGDESWSLLNGTLPARVTARPSLRVLGIASTSYTVTTHESSDYGHEFAASVPPGDYDLYIEPYSSPDPACNVPPSLLLGQRVADNVTLDVRLPAPTSLPLAVYMPVSDASLEGWRVDLIDSASGRLLSTRGLISGPPAEVDASSGPVTGRAWEYRTTLEYTLAYSVEEDPDVRAAEVPGDGIVRLTPPEGMAAPVILRALGGLFLASEVGLVDLRRGESNAVAVPALPSPVWIEGQVARSDDASPARATVTLKATELEGLAPPVSFIRTVSVDESGRFDLEVLPGKYSVRAIPDASSGLAATEVEWQVASGQSPQAGKLVELPPAPLLRGAALVRGGPAFGAAVRAVASPSPLSGDVLYSAQGAEPQPPQAASGLVSGDGSFAIEADPGTYDFFVQPEARSRYAWLVVPSLVVNPGAPEVNLGRIELPLPVIHRGVVSVKGTDDVRVPGALIRAYAYVKNGVYSPTPEGASAVQVAEARADSSGGYELLIPETLKQVAASR